MTEYEGIFFDIGGVILNLTSVQAGHVDFLTRVAEQEGIENVEAFIEEWRSTLGTYFRERDGTEFRRAKTGYQRAVDTAVGYELPESEWMPAFEAASAACLEPNPAATETIRTLDRAGMYLGIVSDIDTWEAKSMLAQFDLIDRFDHVTTSEEAGRTKPDPAIFETALKKAPVEPEQCLYVGDRYEHDMKGGSQAGVVTVAYGGSATEHADSAAVDYVINNLSGLCDLVGV
ncbi:HAD family hydrolase [Halocatena pleomorpha]|uniref:HAD family hydrolase n=1 Tax=Halocatena pleomorpha TaxID=1785090 RepID=A0A3P3RDP5_9EURY|nr:HAD family hydrolase [Halocatena pleomorpha]RRJ30573.1 HAD family hydrolase [Halocatena pleomorpha]